MATLYEIDKAILECVDMETGEIIDEEKLNALEMERREKIIKVCCWIKNLRADVSAIKEEKMNLAQRQSSKENQIDRLVKWVGYALNGEKLEDPKVVVTYRKSESVEFAEGFDYSKLPKEFQNVKIEPKKNDLKAAIKAGKKIKGVSIVEKQNTQIK